MYKLSQPLIRSEPSLNITLITFILVRHAVLACRAYATSRHTGIHTQTDTRRQTDTDRETLSKPQMQLLIPTTGALSQAQVTTNQQMY